MGHDSNLHLDSIYLQGALLWLGVLVVALLVGRFAPQRRPALRRVVPPAALLSAMVLVLEFLPVSVLTSFRQFLSHAVVVLFWTLIINGAALVLFELVLPRFVRLSRIAHDLSVGGAYIALAFVFLGRFGVDFSSLLATSAVVTAIVAISMQATLGNAFSGLTLQLDRSVSEGDWIRLDDGTEGRVQSVRWRHTVIETRNWDTIIVPNSMLVGQKFMVLGKREGEALQHRMWVYFNVDFRRSPAEVIEAVETGLRGGAIPGVAATPAPNCVCMDFIQPDSAIRYAVRYWLTNLAADDPTNSLVRARVFAALRRAKIPLAVPAATLFVENQDTDATERKAEKRRTRRLEAVQNMPLCAGLTDAEQEHVARHLKFSPFAAGEVISREGANAHWLYILDRGEVEIRAKLSGQERTVGALAAPDYFGEHGMLTGAPRTATVVAGSEVECYRLDHETLDELLQSRPEIAQDIANVLAKRQHELAQLRQEVEGEQGLTANDRRAQILARMQEFFGLGR